MLRRRRLRGLTLLETVLAIGLMVLIAGTMFGFYDIAMTTRELASDRLSRGQTARSLAFRIAEDIRAANGFLPGLGPGISGFKNEIKLQTVLLPDRVLFEPRRVQDEPEPAQCDIREVRYYVAVDPEETETYADPESPEVTQEGMRTLGIVRREVKTLRQDVTLGRRSEKVDLDLISEELRYLRFRYFDGVDWVEEWQPPEGGMGNSLPQAVEVIVGTEPAVPEDRTELDLTEEEDALAPPEPYNPERYSVVVRLNQADVFFGSRLMRASKRAFGKSDSN